VKRLKSGGFNGPTHVFGGMNPYLALGRPGNGQERNDGNWSGEGNYHAVKVENWNEYGNGSYAREGDIRAHTGETTEESP
jgi:hypothetical protein